MAKAREIRSFDYVNHPYEKVRDLLRKDALAVFRAATRAASTRAHDVAAALRVQVAGLELGREIVIAVESSEERHNPALATTVLRQTLRWEAAKSPRLFPLMHAELSVYALTATETQLDLLGNYEVPLGPLGKALDAVVGHRLAEASVHQFLADVAAFLRKSVK
jgi:hypothetical protein